MSYTLLADVESTHRQRLASRSWRGGERKASKAGREEYGGYQARCLGNAKKGRAIQFATISVGTKGNYLVGKDQAFSTGYLHSLAEPLWARFLNSSFGFAELTSLNEKFLPNDPSGY